MAGRLACERVAQELSRWGERSDGEKERERERERERVRRCGLFRPGLSQSQVCGLKAKDFPNWARKGANTAPTVALRSEAIVWLLLTPTSSLSLALTPFLTRSIPRKAAQTEDQLLRSWKAADAPLEPAADRRGFLTPAHIEKFCIDAIIQAGRVGSVRKMFFFLEMVLLLLFGLALPGQEEDAELQRVGGCIAAEDSELPVASVHQPD